MAHPDPAVMLGRLAPLWAEALGTATVSADDNFFALGGQSLTAVRLIGRIKQDLGVSLQLPDVFDYPRLGELADFIAAGANQATPGQADLTGSAEPKPSSYSAPLAPGQQSLWRIEQVLGDAAPFNQVLRVDVTGDVDLGLLVQALRSVVARHDALRVTIADSGGGGVQTVHPAAQVPVTCEDAETSDPGARTATMDRICRAAQAAPFDLTRQIPIRASAVTFGPADHALVITTHHIAFDGWSRQILVSELAATYRGLLTGDQPPARGQSRFPEFAAWQAEQAQCGGFADAVRYWTDALTPALPELRLAGATPGGEGIGATALRDLTLPADLAEQVAARARDSAVTEFTILLCAFMAVLAEQSGHDQVQVAVEAANRDLTESQDAIGPFANTLVVRVPYDRSASFLDFLGAVRSRVLEAYQYQAVPFEFVVEQLRAAGQADVPALLRIGFSVNPSYPQEITVPGGTLLCSAVGRSRDGEQRLDPTTFDLVLEMRRTGAGIDGFITYKANLYDERIIDQLVTDYADTLRRCLSSLPGVPGWPDER